MKTAFENWLTKKLTTPDLDGFLKKHKTDVKTLVVNCNDSPYQHYFKNRIKVDDKGEKGARKIDYYDMPFADESFEVVLCTGLLEHLEEPGKVLKEIRRVLKKGGKVLIGASSAFSIHDAPHDFFHFTPYGLEYLLKKQGWNQVEVKGSCSTMKTIGILLQRIAFQTKTWMPIRALIFLIAKIIPHLQIFIGKEYGDIKHEVEVENLLSSNVHASAEK